MFTSPNLKPIKAAMRSVLVAGMPLLLLGACAPTRFISSQALDNTTPDVTNPDQVVDMEPGVWWARQYTLPVEIHGTLPGHSQAEMAALSRRTAPDGKPAAPVGPSIADRTGRILMYVSPARLPEDDALCQEAQHVGHHTAGGGATPVTVAQCDADKTLAVVHGVVTADASADQVRSGLGTMQSALFWDLYKTPFEP